jgi:hypothetical protein
MAGEVAAAIHPELLGKAIAMSAVAAAVDYGVTPRRLTPCWELTLSMQSMAAAFASLAVGLADGALVSRELRRNGQAATAAKC